MHTSIYLSIFLSIYLYIHTYRQTDRRTDRQTGRQIDRQTDRRRWKKLTCMMTPRSGGMGCPSLVHLMRMGRSPLPTTHATDTRSPCLRCGKWNASTRGGSIGEDPER